jgi:dTDP-4-dehydrorhamnose reductase
VKIMLLGKNGQIGWELQRFFLPLGQLVALGSKDLDLLNKQALRSAVREIKPDIIINAAAYTAVDKAEEEPELALAVNGVAPGILAEEAARLNALMIHYSTDYVFDGRKESPYSEDDIPNPINTYGKTKLAGERAIRETGASHLIFRTGWVYGSRGKNFLLTILRLAREKDQIRIVDDQVGTPNWCRTLAEVTARIIKKESRSIGAKESLSGIYNLSASGETSWFKFAQEILAADPRKEEHVCKTLFSIKTGQYPTPAKRPMFSVLDNKKIQQALGVKIRQWDCYLNEFFQQGGQ